MSYDIEKIIDSLAEKLRIPAEYLIDQLIKYRFALSIGEIVLGFVLAAVAVFAYRIFQKNQKKGYESDDVVMAISVIFMVVSLVFALGFFLIGIFILFGLVVSPVGSIIAYLLSLI